MPRLSVPVILNNLICFQVFPSGSTEGSTEVPQTEGNNDQSSTQEGTTESQGSSTLLPSVTDNTTTARPSINDSSTTAPSVLDTSSTEAPPVSGTGSSVGIENTEGSTQQSLQTSSQQSSTRQGDHFHGVLFIFILPLQQ